VRIGHKINATWKDNNTEKPKKGSPKTLTKGANTKKVSKS
jgi:hypothetical protein